MTRAAATAYAISLAREHLAHHRADAPAHRDGRDGWAYNAGVSW